MCIRRAALAVDDSGQSYHGIISDKIIYSCPMAVSEPACDWPAFEGANHGGGAKGLCQQQPRESDWEGTRLSAYSIQSRDGDDALQSQLIALFPNPTCPRSSPALSSPRLPLSSSCQPLSKAPRLRYLLRTSFRNQKHASGPPARISGKHVPTLLHRGGQLWLRLRVSF